MKMLSLAPSDIHFLQQGLTLDEASLAALSLQFEGGRIPKVQVAEKDGAWFALNNSYLHIARDLERKGRCARVGVEVVPLARVPKSLQEGMVVSDSSCRSSSWSEADDDSSSYTSSDYSDDDDLTDSEYEEEELSCNVCERRFNSFRLLEQHRRNRCHAGCCYATKSPAPTDDSDAKRSTEETERLL